MNVPVPRRYDNDAFDYSPAAEYRAIREKLESLGYVQGSQYERTMRALLELEHMQVTLMAWNG